MGISPVFAIPALFKYIGASLKDVDVIELNEAFASQSLYCIRKLGLDIAKVNPNGGAIAIGHPTGATGARQVATLFGELKRSGGEMGLVSMCARYVILYLNGPTANLNMQHRFRSSLLVYQRIMRAHLDMFKNRRSCRNTCFLDLHRILPSLSSKRDSILSNCGFHAHHNYQTHHFQVIKGSGAPTMRHSGNFPSM